MIELEKLSQQGYIDLFYGDESHICSEGYVPYGWQFPDENVHIAVQKGYKVNMFGLISRTNECHWATNQQNIDAFFIFQQIEELSFKISKQTFLVLDNAPVHKAKIIQQQIPIWQKRGVYIYYLPPYSPELNIAEILWRKMKTQWITPEDYLEKEALFYAVNRCFASIGKNLTIKFSHFNIK